MDGIYSVCSMCGAVIADTELHEQWHMGHGEQVPSGE